jgi:hypothetical protein
VEKSLIRDPEFGKTSRIRNTGLNQFNFHEFSAFEYKKLSNEGPHPTFFTIGTLPEWP